MDLEKETFPERLRCAIISGGEKDTLAGIAQADLIVAVDRGYQYAQENGIMPHIWIGDFDSYSAPLDSDLDSAAPPAVQTIAPTDPKLQKPAMEENAAHLAQVEIIQLPTVKDDSDTLAALRHCLQLGYQNFQIYCALGGRLDHFIANLQAGAFAAQNGAKVQIISETERITFLHNCAQSFLQAAGWALSVFSFSDNARGVTIKGAVYELENADLTNTFPIGLSNQWGASQSVEISVANGILVVVESKLH